MTRTTSLANLILAAALAFAPRSAGQTVTTLAGSGRPDYVNGTRLDAAFNHPQGVAVDSWGNVYVADTGNYRIRKIAAGGPVTTLAGSGSRGYNPPEVPAAAASFWGPLGLAVDAAGALWVADQDDFIDGQWLLKITTDGILHLTDLYRGDGSPFAVATAGLKVYVLDWITLWRIPASGAPTALATGLTGAAGIAVDTAGTVYVADVPGNRILKVTAAGVLTTLAGSGRAGYADGAARDAAFNGPAGVAVDREGRVYVADTGNNTIRWIAPDGFVTTLAGSGAEGKADGFGSSATFSRPAGIAADGHGSLYVADTGNNLIRRIALEEAACATGCTTWFVPSAARAPGAGGAFWTTDLVLHNRASVPVSTTLKFLGHDADGSDGPEKVLTLEPHQTVTYADVLSSAFGLSAGYGAVAVRTSSFEISVRSRTATVRDGGTVGDGAPGVRQSSFFTDQTSLAPVLTGLREDGRFRTNLVLVNGSSAPIDVLVTAFDAAGAAVGARTYSLPPLGMTQDARFLGRVDFGAGARADATVTLSSPTPGALFTASAVVIDNASNAPTTVLPQ